MPLGRKAKIESSDDSEGSSSVKILDHPGANLKGELEHKEVPKVDEEKGSPDDEDNRNVVEGVLGKKVVLGRDMYLLKWCGYPRDQSSWAPIENCDCQELIDEYESKQKIKRHSYYLRNRSKAVVFCDMQSSVVVDSSQNVNQSNKSGLKPEMDTSTLEHGTVQDEPHPENDSDQSVPK
ncbi:hypothetical protein ACOME3_002430 [Neoechinorhynchus agilis]